MPFRTEAMRNGVYVELVRSLYTTLIPTVIMSIGYVLSFSVMALQSSNSILAGFAIAGLVSSGVRIGVVVGGRKSAAAATFDIKSAHVLEKRFAIAYFQFAALLGASAVYAFMLELASFHMLIICLLVGYGAGVAAGVGLRPWIAIPSMLVAIVPTIGAATLSWDAIYWVTAAMMTALLAGGSLSLLGRHRVASAEIAKRLTFEALARQDVLTALPNRLALREWFDTRMANGSGQPRQLLAVHCLDLDNFKPVNDVFGHPVGDSLLKEIARRLTEVLSPGDIAARLGGDEFAVIQHDLCKPDDAAVFAQRLRAAIAVPFSILGHDISVSTCVGYTLCHSASVDLEELLGLADQALYVAKNDGTGVHSNVTATRDDGRVAA